MTLSRWPPCAFIAPSYHKHNFMKNSHMKCTVRTKGLLFLYLYLTKCIFNISPVCITNQQQFVSWWSSPSFCFNIYNKCEDGQQNSQTSVEKTSDLTSDAQWSAFDYSSLCIFTICAECGHQLKQQSCLHKRIWCSYLLLRPGSGGWHN